MKIFNKEYENLLEYIIRRMIQEDPETLIEMCLELNDFAESQKVKIQHLEEEIRELKCLN